MSIHNVVVLLTRRLTIKVFIVTFCFRPLHVFGPSCFLALLVFRPSLLWALLVFASCFCLPLVPSDLLSRSIVLLLASL